MALRRRQQFRIEDSLMAHAALSVYGNDGLFTKGSSALPRTVALRDKKVAGEKIGE